jgi:hypothetical protein
VLLEHEHPLVPEPAQETRRRQAADSRTHDDYVELLGDLRQR